MSLDTFNRMEKEKNLLVLGDRFSRMFHDARTLWLFENPGAPPHPIWDTLADEKGHVIGEKVDAALATALANSAPTIDDEDIIRTLKVLALTSRSPFSQCSSTADNEDIVASLPLNANPGRTDVNIDQAASTSECSPSLLIEPSRNCPDRIKPPPTFSGLLMWSILPTALWYLAANGLAYYFTSRHYWIDFRHEALVWYALMTLYAVPVVLTIVTGFMSWGYALSMYGSGRGTIRAFGIFALQWLVVWALVKASIHWHYVYFFTEQLYS